MNNLVPPVTTTALPNHNVPAPAISIFELVKEWIINCYRTFKNIDMYWVIGGHTITLWQILLSLFVAGTIINFIVGAEDDPSENE